uniref:Uncharacterized protein LOC111104953 n=1 Tax=Crassostrea virginica TaxID=6565 RepID=A0A8B8AVW7_CRAVI|nr:uncharacterized protein LOC111104953 [Crassostrea virginica]
MIGMTTREGALTPSYDSTILNSAVNPMPDIGSSIRTRADMATEEDEEFQKCYEKEISEWICNELLLETLSNSKMISARKNMIMVLDFIDSLSFRGVFSKHSVGSRGEMTALVDESDADSLYLWEKIMLCQPTVHKDSIWENVMICQDAELANEQKCVIILLDRTDCTQGYTKLKLIINETLKEAIKKGGKLAVMDLTKRTPDGIYLLNTKVIEFFSHLTLKKGTCKVFRHGPCATANFKSGLDYKNKAPPDIEYDNAQGFRICNLTIEGEHWLHLMNASEKERVWPSAKTVKKISTLSCEVVAVGGPDPDSPDSVLKWRISYTLWERELIWSFWDVQFHCFMFLKFFLKRRLKFISEDLTTYHMKTVVFWESVNCSLEMLQSTANFLAFLKKCLIRLCVAIDEQKLLHFIHRDRNLFESKFTDEKAKRNLLTYLEENLIGPRYLVPVVFNCIGRNDIKELWDRYGLNPTEFLSRSCMSNVNSLEENDQELRKFKSVVAYGLEYIWGIKLKVVFATSDEMPDKFLKKLDNLSKLGVEKKYIDMTEKIFRFYYKLMPSKSCLYTDKDLSDYISNRKTCYTDALSDRLYVSTCLIRYGRFFEAEGNIDEFLYTDTKLYFYFGVCSVYNGIGVEKGKVTYVNNCLGVADDEFPLVHDILISNRKNGCFPPAIRIQSSLETCVYLNPVVYMFYLKVLCDINANRNTDYSLQGLYDSVHQCGLKRDNFRHFNLLGHAYILTKRYGDAYVCFLKSIHDNVSKNAPNSG